jgi:hypothetical protein
MVANGGVSYTLPAQTQQQIGGCREGVLSRLRTRVLATNRTDRRFPPPWSVEELGTGLF